MRFILFIVIYSPAPSNVFVYVLLVRSFTIWFAFCVFPLVSRLPLGIGFFGVLCWLGSPIVTAQCCLPVLACDWSPRLRATVTSYDA